MCLLHNHTLSFDFHRDFLPILTLFVFLDYIGRLLLNRGPTFLKGRIMPILEIFGETGKLSIRQTLIRMGGPFPQKGFASEGFG